MKAAASVKVRREFLVVLAALITPGVMAFVGWIIIRMWPLSTMFRNSSEWAVFIIPSYATWIPLAGFLLVASRRQAMWIGAISSAIGAPLLILLLYASKLFGFWIPGLSGPSLGQFDIRDWSKFRGMILYSEIFVVQNAVVVVPVGIMTGLFLWHFLVNLRRSNKSSISAAAQVAAPDSGHFIS